MPDPSSLRVSADEAGLYGRDYWFSHQEKNLGNPTIISRSRTDLSERCLHWLRAVLKYRLPPGRVLELGAGHGGFTAMLRSAGFDATGLELSPWVVEFARTTFRVPMLLGSVEEQDLEPASLDAVVLMDVLEHLPDPAGTMRHCLHLLKPDGHIFIQTPRFREGLAYNDLLSRGDRFLEMLQKDEHLYLFSLRAITEFFRRLGVEHIVFEPALFAHYDMFLVASRRPLPGHDQGTISTALAGSPEGRFVQALLDLHARSQDLELILAESEADRAVRLEEIHRLGTLLAESQADRGARLQVIEQLGQQLAVSEADRDFHLANMQTLQTLVAEAEADRTARLDEIHRLSTLLAESETDRGARLQVIEELGQQLAVSEAERAARLDEIDRFSTLLAESEADRGARLQVIEQLERQLAVSEADRHARLANMQTLQTLVAEAEAERAARLDEIHRLGASLAESEADRGARLQVIEQLERQLAVSEADRAARLQVIEAQGPQVTELEAERERLSREVADLRQELSVSASTRILQQKTLDAKTQLLSRLYTRLVVAETVVQHIRNTRLYKLLRSAGVWAKIEQLPFRRWGFQSPQALSTEATGSTTQRMRVAVDLTPMLPGGENGGAKLLAIDLVRHLSQLAPDDEFVLLTSARTHEELAMLDASNVCRLCVTHDGPRPAEGTPLAARWGRRLAAILPSAVMAKVNSAYRAIGHRPRQTALLKDIGANLLFCPFTAPLFFDPTVPVVSVVVDLQHLYYPQFFGPDDRYQRDAHFRTACRFASKLVCISDYVRNTVLEKSGLNADHVVAIHIRLSQRLAGSSPEKQAQIIGQFGLSGVRFLLYPANFWPHKNHRMLLTAFGMYRNRHPRSDLKLVCTGTPGANMDTLRDAATRAGLDGWVLFPGFLPDEEFAALLESSLALIFPSLYEGFGMPVLEAMALGKPVLCSNVTSLPEIAGDAAILFDPRKPADITHAIERLEDDPALAADLSGRGKQRAAAFGDPAEMAAQYLRVFSEVIGSQSSFADGIHGVYLDGWTNERVVVTYRASDEPRHLEVTFTVPAWLPCERVTAKASHNGNESPEPYVMPRGETTTLRVALPRTSGHLELTIDPVFQPRALRLNDDERTLGCLCQGCRLVSPGGVIDLLATNAG